MAVYVDDMEAEFGRMKMCHMFADSHDELLAMADRIGVARRWIQKAGTCEEHFDVCLSKRDKALSLGAKLFHYPSRELAEFLNARREKVGGE